MARLVLANLDLNGNQILGLRIEVLAADPTGGGLYEGRLWFNSTSNLLKYYDGTVTVELAAAAAAGVQTLTVDDASIENTGTAGDPIINIKALGVTNAMLAGSIANGKLATDPLARANHTGTQLAATLSDLATAILARSQHTGTQVAATISDLATAILARSQHTGTQISSTISDLATVVKAYRLDEFADPTSDIPMAGMKFTGLAEPADAQDSATKNYVDAVAAGLSPKDSVRAATTANGTLATAFENADAIDGVTLATGDRILLKNQTAPAENGIYVVAASGAPTRATDSDSAADLLGAAVFVSEGTVNGNTLWVMTTDAPITVNTTGLVWSQFAGPGAVTAGTGITVTGQQVALTIPVAITSGGTGQITAAAALVALGGVGRASFDVGDNAAVAFVLTHALSGGRDVVVSVRRSTTPWDEVLCDVEMTSTTTVTLRFAVAPTTNQFRATIVG